MITTEFHLAALQGNRELVTSFLADHEVDEVDEQGRTPLVTNVFDIINGSQALM